MSPDRFLSYPSFCEMGVRALRRLPLEVGVPVPAESLVQEVTDSVRRARKLIAERFDSLRGGLIAPGAAFRSDTIRALDLAGERAADLELFSTAIEREAQRGWQSYVLNGAQEDVDHVAKRARKPLRTVAEYAHDPELLALLQEALAAIKNARGTIKSYLDERGHLRYGSLGRATGFVDPFTGQTFGADTLEVLGRTTPQISQLNVGFTLGKLVGRTLDHPAFAITLSPYRFPKLLPHIGYFYQRMLANARSSLSDIAFLIEAASDSPFVNTLVAAALYSDLSWHNGDDLPSFDLLGLMLACSTRAYRQHSHDAAIALTHARVLLHFAQAGSVQFYQGAALLSGAYSGDTAIERTTAHSMASEAHGILRRLDSGHEGNLGFNLLMAFANERAGGADAVWSSLARTRGHMQHLDIALAILDVCGRNEWSEGPPELVSPAMRRALAAWRSDELEDGPERELLALTLARALWRIERRGEAIEMLTYCVERLERGESSAIRCFDLKRSPVACLFALRGRWNAQMERWVAARDDYDVARRLDPELLDDSRDDIALWEQAVTRTDGRV